MDHIRLREFARLAFQDPREKLVRLRALELEAAKSNLPLEVKQLRTNQLKAFREMREAALFCYGMSQRIGQTVFMARSEAQDYDFVASWVVDDVQHFAPVQLKEVPPVHRNPTASLEAVIASLSKYVDSKDLTVAVHLNRVSRFEPSKLRLPALGVAGLWFFGAISIDQREWGLWGDVLECLVETRFNYPT